MQRFQWGKEMKDKRRIFSVFMVALILCGWIGAWGGNFEAQGSNAPEPTVAKHAQDAGDPQLGTDIHKGEWWAEVQKNIQKQEYHVTYQKNTSLIDIPEAYHAPNRAQNLRTYFTPEKIEIVNRKNAESKWRSGLAVESVGRDELIVNLPKNIIPTVSGAHIEYKRGPIVEWYENRPEGLEQGFTINERLEGEGEFIITLRVSGNLNVELADNQQEVFFMDDSGKRVMRYGDLKVVDAHKDTLTSYFQVSGNVLRILVDDNNAAYPIVVDPLFQSTEWTFEGDKDSAAIGTAVYTAGDVNGDGFADIVVGASTYNTSFDGEGKIFVFHGSETGLSITPDWSYVGGMEQALFGCSVATAGDINDDGYSDIIVGARHYAGGQYMEGAAYAFYGSAGGLSATGMWMVESNESGSDFGISVGTAGDVNGDGYSDVIVGTSFSEYHSAPQYGKAYVYYGSTSGLPTSASWTAEGDQTFCFFGKSVGTAGDVNGDGYSDVIIGAPNYDNDTETDEGEAFVYYGSSTGLGPNGTPGNADWKHAPDAYNLPDSNFGYSVSTAGDTNGDGYSDIIVGASGYATQRGMVWVFLGSSTGLAAEYDTYFLGEVSPDKFGASVACAGDLNGDGYSDVIVGAQLYDGASGDDDGKVYIFKGSTDGLPSLGFAADKADWTEEGTQLNEFFGSSVGPAGDIDGDGYSDIIIGAQGYDDLVGVTYDNVGRASVYYGSLADSLESEPSWDLDGENNSANLGCSVSSAGDVNADGYMDVIVGADMHTNNYTWEGRATVFHGSANGLAASPAWYIDGGQSIASLGCSVSSAGDVNGDGYSDVIVGDRGHNGHGAAFAFYGSSSGLVASNHLPSDADWFVEGDGTIDCNLGSSVASIGDVNGDGYDDVIVGASAYTRDFNRVGAAWVYLGSAQGLGQTPVWTLYGDMVSGTYLSARGLAGDVNGDGYDDFMVSSTYSNGEASEGAVFVFYGDPDSLSTTPSWHAEGNLEAAGFGNANTVGDIDGDGYSDIIIRASGLSYLYRGSSTGLDLDGTRPVGDVTNADWQYDVSAASSIGTAGDVNGDGFIDLVIGKSGDGNAHIFLGPPTGSSPIAADWSYTCDQADADFGSSAATAGDVNGDGYSDVVIGAHYYDSSGYTNNGRAFLFYGNGSNGVSRRPRQFETNYTPIPQGGKSNSETAFILSAIGRSPLGRSRITMEWEVKPAHEPFNDDGPFFTTGWYNTYVSGYYFNRLVSGLTGHTPYHWRARFRYPVNNSAGLVVSRWFSPFPGHSVHLETNNTPPIGGYTSNNSIPASQISQSKDGKGIITVQFRVKDAGRNLCSLQDFHYYDVYQGIYQPVISTSGSLGGGWPDNDGSLYISAIDFSGPVYSFTFNTKHPDVASFFLNEDNSNVRIRFRVNDGLDAGAYVNTGFFRVDNLAPATGSITITDNAGYTNDSTPPLGLTSSGANDMSFALSEGGPWVGPYTYSTGFSSFNISTGGNGPKTVWVEFIDEFGNVQTTHASDTTIYDTVAPIGSINIEGGAMYANSVSVTLEVSASDSNGAKEMRFSNDGGPYSTPETYSPYKAWSLNPSQGIRTVAVQFRDQAGNWSLAFTDTIILDTDAPLTGSISIQGGDDFVGSENVTLDLTAVDSSGISRMQFSNDGDTYDTPISYATAATWDLVSGDGNKTVYVQFEDQAGNWSLDFTDTIYLDMTPPVSQISSPEYANGDSITLTWSVSDGSGSGVQETTFLSKRLAGANWDRQLHTVPPGEFEFDASEDGDYYFALVSTDNLDNVETDPTDVNDPHVAHTIYDTGKPCSEATEFSFDDPSGKYTITFIYDDIFAGESPCQGASSGSGVVQVALHVVKPDDSEEVIIATGGDLGIPFEYTPPSEEEGLYKFYTIATDIAGNVEDVPAEGSDLETIYTKTFPGYAILAVGSIASDPDGLISHTKTANNVYAHLINRNFAMVGSIDRWEDPYDQIRYYNPYELGQIGEDAIGASYWGTMQSTITSWALDKMRLRPGPLYIILINHGSDDRFYLEPPAYFTAQQLSDWLDALDEDMAAEGIAPQKIIIVIGTCQSGSFMGDLAKENRIIVASSAGNEPSYRGPMEPDGVRDGEFFTTSLFNALGQGLDLKTSYQLAVEEVELHTDSGETNAVEPYFDTARQHPRLEDDGFPPYGSHTPVIEGDGDAAQEIKLGADTIAVVPLEITTIDKPETPLNSGQNVASFWIEISYPARHDIAWMEVRPPDLILDESIDPSQQEIVDLVEVPLTWNDAEQRFEGDFYDFWLEGRYSVFFYVRDSDSGIISPPAMTYVYKEKSSGANNPPGSFSLLMPEEGTGWHTTFEGFGAAWEQSIDPDGDAVSYTIEIRNDETDGRWATDTFFYRQEGILKNNVVVGPEASFVDLRYYKWQIIAVDQYGEETPSNEEWQFEMNDTDPFPGFLDIFIFDANTNQGIASATLQSDGGHNIVSTGGGYYFGTGSPGSYSLDVQASGYHSVIDLPLNLREGSFVVLTIGLNAIEPEKFGDVDGTPPVNLADAILTLQIMSGLNPGGVHLDADVDGDGKIGKQELIFILQKVAGLR